MKKYSKLLILITIIILGAGFNEAYAEPICIAITADVAMVSDPQSNLDGAINVGDIITGVYVYESTTTDTNSLPSVGTYSHTTAPYGIILNAGGLIFRTNPYNVDFLVSIGNDHGFPNSHDRYILISYSNIFDVGSNSDNLIAWQLDDPTLNALSSDALPTLPPVLAEWQSLFGLCIGSVPQDSTLEDYFFVRSHVTSATLCDEPSQKVAICHMSETRAERTLFLPPSSILDHLGHGDILGECPY